MSDLRLSGWSSFDVILEPNRIQIEPYKLKQNPQVVA